MKPISVFIFLSAIALLLSSSSAYLTPTKDLVDEKNPFPIETKKSEVMKAVPHLKIADEEEFLTKACNYTHHKETCKSILKSIGDGQAHKINTARLAYKAVRLAQNTCSDIAIVVIHHLDENKVEAPVKKALDGCYNDYMDLLHEIREALVHVQRKKGLHDAKNFTATAGVYPVRCEQGLIRAGSNGEKLGMYKNYKDLSDIAEACHSLIHYLIELRAAEAKKKD